MADGNIKNLVPFDKRTEEEQRRIAKQGGIASGKARREKADMKKALQLALEMKYGNSDKTGVELITASMIAIAGNPKNAKAVDAYKAIWNVIGQEEATEAEIEKVRQIFEGVKSVID